MKRLQLFLLVLFLLTLPPNAGAQDVWDGTTVATSFDGGTGTRSDPYRIRTAAQFVYLIERTITDDYYSRGDYYVLTQDISLNKKPLPHAVDNDRQRGVFKGHLNGQNHMILDYDCQTDGSYSSACLFYSVTGDISNLGINVSESVRRGYPTKCAITETLISGSTIFNCYVFLNSIGGGYAYMATGIAERNYGTIVDCIVEGSITTGRNGYGDYKTCAAIAIDNESTGKIINCDITNYTISDDGYCPNPKPVVVNNYGTIDYGNVMIENKGTITNTDNLWTTWKSEHPDADYRSPVDYPEECTICFEDPYGLVNYSPITVKGGTCLSEVISNPSVENCIFEGWSYLDNPVQPSMYRVKSDMTLTANWIQKLTKEPTADNPVVEVSDPDHAKYQWYIRDKSVQSFDGWTSTRHEAYSSEQYTISFMSKEGETLNIDWETSTEKGCDELRIYIDNTLILRKSGKEAGTLAYSIKAEKEYKLKVCYVKDESGSDGEDIVRVSNIKIGVDDVPINGMTTPELDQTIVRAGNRYYCQVTYSNSTMKLESQPVSYENDYYTDISEMENVIYASDTKAYMGYKIVIPVRMKHSMKVNGWSFKVILPEGLKVDAVSRGREMLQTVQNSENEYLFKFDGAGKDSLYYVQAYNIDGDYLQPGDDEIALVSVVLAGNVAPGDYQIPLFECELSCDGEYVLNRKTVGKLTLKQYEPGDANGDGRISITDITTISSHLLGKKPENIILEASDANSDGRISITDITTIANRLLGK